MVNNQLFMGIDLGTSGARIAIINIKNELIYSQSVNYSKGLENINDWTNSVSLLIKDIPKNLSKNLIACSIDGTSGTLIACNYEGKAIGEAIPYFINFPKTKEDQYSILESKTERDKLSLNSSIYRASQLIRKHGENILLRHQADWISGWLLENWESGEEGNNLKFGWDVQKKSWPKFLETVKWKKALPQIVSSGSHLGNIASRRADELGLPNNLKIIAGTTDSNAAVLAANDSQNNGYTILGSTIVIKLFRDNPIKGAGISNHLIGGRYLCGGASNSGAAVLKKFFTEKQLCELSRQINPEKNSGLSLIPMISEGERFPIEDPFLKPVLTPRPTSDSLYLHALLEGLALIEAQGWEKLIELGARKPKEIITLGGGAHNQQWRRIRERLIGIPIKSCKKPPAQGVAKLAMESILKIR